ncbi:MAG: DUF1553 domain-containing protein [Planctomycetia bacterium]
MAWPAALSCGRSLSGIVRSLVAVACVAAAAAGPGAAHAAGPADGVSILTGGGNQPLPHGRIDELLAASNQANPLAPAPLIDDTTYLRRVTIDLVGRIPTAAECRLYAAEPAVTRRHRLVRRLVASERFADRFAVWLGDMLRVRAGAAGGPELDRFLRRSMRDRLPHDQIVRQLLTAVGTPDHDGAIGYFAAAEADPLEMAGVVAQTLLGIRLKCARCHDHPFDHWSQREYYGLAAFFGETRSMSPAANRPVRMVDSASQRVQWPPRDGPHAGGSPAAIEPAWPLPSAAADEPALAAALERRRAAKEPSADEAIDQLLVDAIADASSGAPLAQVAAVAVPAVAGTGALRRTLADRVTDPRNRSFARNLANRLWAALVGRGLVEPVDDFRADNPPRHPELLDHLADELVASGHDIRHVVMLIVASDAYARRHADAEDPAVRRRLEDACLAAPRRPLPAEALHDSLITAGHLHAVKHPPGANMKPVEERVLVRREPADDGSSEDAGAGGAVSAAVAEAVLGGRLAVADADDDPAMGDLSEAMMDADPLAGMRALTPGDKSAAPVALSAEEIARLYRVETVIRQVDLNPLFAWAIEMPLPAPPQHFLRLLGQSSREDGDDAERRPHMRQALMLLNGPLVHEAARVGPLEPLGRAIAVNGRLDLVGLLYLEALSRNPTAEARAAAEDVIAAAAAPADGVADMRWALFNSREFRFIP